MKFEILKGLSSNGCLIRQSDRYYSVCHIGIAHVAILFEFWNFQKFPILLFVYFLPFQSDSFFQSVPFWNQTQTIWSQKWKLLPIFQIWISNSPLPFSPSDRLPFRPLLRPSMAAPADRLRPVVKFSGQGIRFDEDDSTETRPLLSRMLTYPIGIFHHQLRRRLGVGKPQVLRRQQSFSRDFGHAAAETFLITRLSFTLLRSLG